MTKITFYLIDGKPVPHVWTMPEPIILRLEQVILADLAREKYNEAIAHARDNAIPVDERFMDEVKKKCYESQVQKWGNDKTIKHWTPDLTRDYDVDMEFEIEEMETNETIFSDGGGWRVKVAILKTEEVESVKNKEHEEFANHGAYSFPDTNIEELIKSIHIDEANFNHIAKSKKINGTLYLEIKRILTEYKEK